MQDNSTTKSHAKNWCIQNLFPAAYDHTTPPIAGPTARKKLHKLWLRPVTAPMFSASAELLTRISTPVNVVQAATLRTAMQDSRRLHWREGEFARMELIGKQIHRGIVERMP